MCRHITSLPYIFSFMAFLRRTISCLFLFNRLKNKGNEFSIDQRNKRLAQNQLKFLLSPPSFLRRFLRLVRKEVKEERRVVKHLLLFSL